MPTLEERVQALEDKEAILHLMNAYAHAMDTGRDVDDWNDLYTEDAVWQGTPITSTGGTGIARIEGRKALAEWWLRAGRDEPEYWGLGHRASHHCVVMQDIYINGNRADAVSYGIITAETPNGPIIRVTGRYTDVVVKCPDGRWRFKKRHLERDCTTPDMQVRPMETPTKAEMKEWRQRLADEMAEWVQTRQPWNAEFKAEIAKAKATVA